MSPAPRRQNSFNAKVNLAQGWNRVLCKVGQGGEQNKSCGTFFLSQWKFVVRFYAVAPYEWETKAIACVMRMYCAAPRVHDGLVYLMGMVGRLRVVDLQARAIVEEKNLFQIRSDNYMYYTGEARGKQAGFVRQEAARRPPWPPGGRPTRVPRHVGGGRPLTMPRHRSAGHARQSAARCPGAPRAGPS